MAKTKEEIKNEIADHLARDSRIFSEKIKVDFSNGSVVLSGNVQSYSARVAAEEDTRSVYGVNAVENHLEVSFPDRYQKPADYTIRDSVQNLISWDPDIFLEKISVFVQEGRVVLEGTVNALWKKLRAERLASNAGGVLGIKNKLAVVLTNTISDEKIGLDIVSLLSSNSSLDINKVTVEVINGKVSLTGLVPSRTAFDIAEDIARYTQGVVDVVNRLAIGK